MRVEHPVNEIIDFRKYARRLKGESRLTEISRQIPLLSRRAAGLISHLPGWVIGTAGILAPIFAVEMALLNHVRPAQTTDDNAPVKVVPAPSRDIETSMQKYTSLRYYLDAVFSGQSVDTDSRNIGELLLDGHRFLSEITMGRFLPPVRVETDNPNEGGIVSRWAPVAQNSITAESWETWKNEGDIIKGDLLVTTTQIRPDGTLLVTDWYATETPWGWRFNAVWHNKNGVPEKLIANQTASKYTPKLKINAPAVF